jgi:TonB family protein
MDLLSGGDSTMHLILPESDRPLLQASEYATLSIVAHAVVAWFALTPTTNTFRLPTEERDARAMFLLPPDPVNAANREADIPLPAKPGSGFDEASRLPSVREGPGRVTTVDSARNKGDRSGLLGDEPLAPPPFLVQKVYSAVQVDEEVERYPYSAVPEYPPELSALGVEGRVDAIYVVDTRGRVDTSTIKVMQSDDPRFTESVREALGQAMFRPAKRAGQSVPQLVQQRFSFRLAQSVAP